MFRIIVDADIAIVKNPDISFYIDPDVYNEAIPHYLVGKFSRRAFGALYLNRSEN